MDRTRSPFEGFPLTGLVGVTMDRDTGYDDAPPDPFTSPVIHCFPERWTAILRRPEHSWRGSRIETSLEEEVVIPLEVANEMKRNNPRGVMFAFRIPEAAWTNGRPTPASVPPEEWQRIETELNAAAERAAARFI